MGVSGVIDISADIIRLVSIAGLDQTFEMVCRSCGYGRNYGYMHLTAEREYDHHRSRYPDHVVDLIIQDAPLLTPALVKQHVKFRAKGAPRLAIISIEPDTDYL